MQRKSFFLLCLISLISFASCSKEGFIPTKNKGSVAYEIFVREFADSNNDGIGDFKGVESKLDYLSNMGIKTLWLMPIHPSTSYHGYNVDDYFDVHKDFGTLKDFDSLVNEAKKKDMDIMLDMVFNHSGNKNIWFDLSYQDYKNNDTSLTSYADFYNWSKEKKNGYHKKDNDIYYEGYFDSSMPDLNLSSSKLREQIEEVCKFWIKDHGVKGFRLDAIIHYFGENSINKNNEFLSWLDQTCKKYNPNFYMVGEAWSDDVSQLQYFKSGIESVFNFNSSITSNVNASIVKASKGVTKANDFGNSIEEYERELKKNNPNGYSSYFLSNHDLDRISKNFKDINEYKTNANLYLLLPGMPFIYYGEEIALKGVRGNEPTDAARRLPMIWSKDDKSEECKPPVGAPKYEQVSLGAFDLLKDSSSLTCHYRNIINIRNKYSFMKDGVFTNLTASLNSDSTKVLSYSIVLEDEGAIFVHNFDKKEQKVKNIGGTLLDSITLDNEKVSLTKDFITLPPQSSAIISLK